MPKCDFNKVAKKLLEVQILNYQNVSFLGPNDTLDPNKISFEKTI